MKFFGIDLGWSSGASGLCCLNWVENRLALVNLERLTAIADILQWLDQHLTAGESAVVAVDAPTLIPNASGMRLPDRLAHQYFSRYHAGCYPANLGRPFAERTVGFGLSLEARGFIHAPHLSAPQPEGRYQLEVFPHAAAIHLFQLDRILKYKKGRVAERRNELSRFRHLLLQSLPQIEPTLPLLDEPPRTDLPPIPAGGTELKAVEDQLDSLLCAYTAAHWWYWGSDRNWVLGDRTSGYIVVPTPFGRLGTA
ncbi:MAG: DUF429 domain-containing protein [Synechococcales bacterium]|nr:DUF429 domain-containing protein [Synechococcales bacterium]